MTNENRAQWQGTTDLFLPWSSPQVPLPSVRHNYTAYPGWSGKTDWNCHPDESGLCLAQRHTWQLAIKPYGWWLNREKWQPRDHGTSPQPWHNNQSGRQTQRLCRHGPTKLRTSVYKHACFLHHMYICIWYVCVYIYICLYDMYVETHLRNKIWKRLLRAESSDDMATEAGRCLSNIR
jgi:hypothetical protein